MSALFASLNPPKTSNQQASLNRYFRTAQIVASCWTLIGAGVNSWGLDVAKDSPLHAKLQLLGIGSLLIAFAIYSLLIPFYYIHRNLARSDND